MAVRERVIPEKYKGRKIYSISRLNTFDNCQYGYYLTYVKRLKRKQNIYSFLGTVVHEICEDLQDRKITNEEAVKRFDVAVFESIEVHGYKFISEKVQSNYVDSVKIYLKNFKPLEVDKYKNEMEFYTDIAGSVMVGYIDLITSTNDGKVDIYDYKTSSKFGKKDIIGAGRQLVLYAYALEKEKNVKIGNIMWDMLKYCSVRWVGANGKEQSGFYQRNELIEKMQNRIFKDLAKQGKEEFEINMLFNIARDSQCIGDISPDIGEKYIVDRGLTYYDYNKETVKELEEYVKDTVSQIESRSTEKETDWLVKDIKKDSFFCNTLCDQRENCKHYQSFIGNNKNNFKKTDEKEMEELFG